GREDRRDMAMRKFEWEDGFTPYGATLVGRVLTEWGPDGVERVSVITRAPEYDGHPGAEEFTMSGDFSAGTVGAADVVWIDGQAFTLASAGDFPCCVAGHDDATT